MKTRSSKILLTVSIICLLVIAGIIIFGILKNRNNTKNIDYPEILGRSIDSQIIPTAEDNVRGVAQQVWRNSKEEVSQRIETVKNEVVQSVQKEVSSLTQSQIETLKLQICRDLGVLPTITPAPKP